MWGSVSSTWNPVKELKVRSQNDGGGERYSMWNPVKELKGLLDSLSRATVRLVWNPVKELKASRGRQGPGLSDGLGVESGEGIERQIVFILTDCDLHPFRGIR